jgi:amino acid transporter
VGSNRDQADSPRPLLGVGDAVSLIVGIIVGVAIYKAPGLIFSNVPGPWEGMAVWALGGALSLLGALCYAELATTYPHSGGEYTYLTRAYGPAVGFAFGWAQLAVLRTGGNIAAISYVFGEYASRLWSLGPGSVVAYAAGAIVILTLTNALGIGVGKRMQNLLTVAKVVGLTGICVAGAFRFLWSSPAPAADPKPVGGASLGLALVLVLYAYGGWNEAAYIAAEVRDHRRNITRALVLGTVAVTLIYLLVNGAYLAGLGFDGVRASSAVAADIFTWPDRETHAAEVMSALVAVSALGAVNGMIFTGSRNYAAFGADHRLFAWLGRWHGRLGSPVGSLAVQALLSMIMVVAVGAWSGSEGFEALVTSTAPVFWAFFLLAGASLFVLRRKDRAMERPFKVPGYPVVPLLFCGACGFMLYSSLSYACMEFPEELICVAMFLIAGLPLYWWSRRMGARGNPPCTDADMFPKK